MKIPEIGQRIVFITDNVGTIIEVTEPGTWPADRNRRRRKPPGSPSRPSRPFPGLTPRRGSPGTSCTSTAVPGATRGSPAPRSNPPSPAPSPARGWPRSRPSHPSTTPLPRSATPPRRSWRIPPVPYDAIKDNHTDLAREAVHPQHVSDTLHSLALLSSLGLTSGSYVLSGHSAGACLALQSVLQPRGTTVSATCPSRPAPRRCSASTACTICPRSRRRTGLAPPTPTSATTTKGSCPGRSGRTRTPGQR